MILYKKNKIIYEVKVLMLLPNCKLMREATLCYILCPECTEQGKKKSPHPFLPKQPSQLTQYSSLPAHSSAADHDRTNVNQTDQPDLFSKDPPPPQVPTS